MRILVTSRPGTGHLAPMLPFAHALARAGDDVLVAVPGAAAGAQADRAGLAVWPLEEVRGPQRDAIFARARALGDGDAANRVVVSEAFIGMDTPAWIPDVDRAAEAFSPDLILADAAEFAGPLVAGHHGIPSARVTSSLPGLLARFLPLLAPALDRVRASAGLRRAPGAGDPLAAPIFTEVPAAFEDPAAPAPAAVHRFRAAAPGPARPLGPWWPGDDRPLVYFTLGTVAGSEGAFPDLYKAAIEVLGELPVRVLVTTGRDADPALLGPLPANVHAERWVRQADVMPAAAAMVCHGGSGTVHAGLAAGVPMVVMPLFADQPQNAARVAALGAGVAIGDGVADLAEAVSRVLAEPSHAAAARTVAREIGAMSPVEDAVALLHDVAGTAAIAA